MGDRKGDVRIYLISGLFLASTVGGGIFLCMYIIYSNSEYVRYYLIAGMTLVAVPWWFWFLIFLYRCCFKPKVGQQFDNRGKVGATKNCSLTAVVTNPSGKKSPDEFLDDGGRHVHFGAVVEMGSGIQDHQEVADKLQRESKEETT
ncbi:hypothetical protein AAZX31_03G083000 [Glycine max]|uniref:Uncharacterized protein n=2 Tax=Glycine subgen. Soja TaxID=1462606 RepID=I1JMB1_SOYBN|nr:hypothetical protein GYH30_006722 [Glycine max]KHN22164.1 hypothetical protein glysoja_034484 [Glycine soja]KRH66232.1 hypothetical protein GLYMA_03G092200v4 [Glycine max]RZC19852.1 hypothetical protein D0Y65_006621 [Glycine soja]